jgi:hypothetical protein
LDGLKCFVAKFLLSKCRVLQINMSSDSVDIPKSSLSVDDLSFSAGLAVLTHVEPVQKLSNLMSSPTEGSDPQSIDMLDPRRTCDDPPRLRRSDSGIQTSPRGSLQFHCEKLDNIDINKVVNDFIMRNEHRRATFAKLQ